jgi:crotonobetainyl-CoA:carnitine CoA-transferase CaiB-like acyl-CoA transferase
MSKRDLSGLSVLEVATTPGAAFAATLLADFGARTIVVEAPPEGSALRRLGPNAVQQVWWPIIARNKQSVAIDPDHKQAAPILQALLRRSDILVRDDAATPWRAAAASLQTQATPSEASRAGPLDLHIFPPGADDRRHWQGSTRSEFASAATGAMALTGEASGPPVQPEFPLAEYSAGMMAAAASLLELAAAARHSRQPAPLAFGLHEALMRMNEWQIVFASAHGRAVERSGNRYPMNANIGNIFRTRDGKLITISAATGSIAGRLLHLIGGAALRDDPRFSTHEGRRTHMDALELEIGAWMARHNAADILRMGGEHDVVMGLIFDAQALRQDPHVQARGNVVEWVDRRGRRITMPGIVPRITGVDSGIRSLGPELGADTDAVLAECGFSASEIASLRRSGVVWK